MSDIKEINFIKQVERTAKRDAYLAALRFIKYYGDDAARYIQMKADGHTEYLRSLPLTYDYATQSLVVNGIDGGKVHEALSSLTKTLKEE